MDEKRLREYLARLTGELRAVRGRLREVEQAVPEPIAIVGMACRYPGGIASPADLWELVSAGGDAISPFPDNRGWPLDAEQDGPEFRREGGFLHDADLFDATFFGINPREALAMNPQQRLVLETSWEAVEHAGIDPTTLRGSRTGVFVGALGDGYGAESGAVPEIDGYQLTGSAGSVVSGRVAYTLGLEGPAVTIDTACSSSLVALHLAGRALREDECSLALAGGVTVMSRPEPFLEMARQGALASDARCKAFADAADGMSMAEGVGMLLVQRLSDARREGRRVLAVIRGTAVNQDGASSGLTAPNGPSQQRVILRALDDARLSPADVDAVEAHGTGTSLGDPIEAQALLATYGRDRSAGRPLWLGSFKSNVGHTAGAAGVGGVIKIVLAMRHGVLPETLHVDAPTRQVDWESGAVRLLTEARPWPDTGEPRRAGVSSFGISGTNAHAILEYDPAADGPSRTEATATGVPAVCVLSGRGETALREQAGRLRAMVEAEPDLTPGEVAAALATTRTGFEHRAAIVAEDRAALLRGLSAVAEGGDAPGVVRGQARDRGKVVFVFPGHGAQRPGMARGLLDSAPVFAARMTECATALSSYVDWSPIDVVRGVEGAPSLDRVDVAQPVLFSVMVSLAALWRSYGVEPDAVVGHSQGEVAAAYVGGALSIEDAVRIIVLRSRALARIAGRGAMAAVALSVEEAVDRLRPWAQRLEIAVVNSARSCVVAGEREALDEFLAVLGNDGVRVRRIGGTVAMHTRQVDELREDLLRDLAPVVPAATGLTYVSTVTGERLDTGELDAGYWCRNLRETVRFDRAAGNLVDGGSRVFVEMSPHPVLAMPLREVLDSAGAADAVVAGSLHAADDGLGRFLTSVAEVATAGVPVDVVPDADGRPTRHVDLPTYPFQRERHWLSTSDTKAADVTAAGLRRADHPLLGAVVSVAGGGGLVLTGRFSGGNPVTALVDLAVHAGDHAGCGVLDTLELLAPLSSPDRGSPRLQVVVGPATDSGGRSVDVYSRPDRDDEQDEWTHHATGTVRRNGYDAESDGLTGTWPPDGAVAVDLADHEPDGARTVSLWRLGADHYVEVGLGADTDANRYGLHPALLAEVLHAPAVGDGVSRRGTDWRSVTLHATGATTVRARLTELGADRYALLVADVEGRPVLSADSVTLSPVPDEHSTAVPDHPLRDSMFQVRWRASTTVDQEAPAGAGCVIGGAEDLAGMTTVPEVVACVLPPETGPLGHAARETTVRALAVLRTWLGDDRFLGSTLVVVTRGTVAVGEEAPQDLPSAPVWGLLRSAQSEHPDRFVLLDLEGGDGVRPEPELTEALLTSVTGLGEPQVALRQGVVHVPRLARVEPAPTEPPRFDPGRTVLITGGTGTVAGLVARHLVAERGVRHVLLTSRRGPAAPGAEQLRAELAGLGARVSVVACDLADRAEVDALVAGVPADHPLTAVVHAAAVVDDGVIEALTPERIATAFAPKVDAVLNLHEATLHLDLTGFVLFSGAAGVLGNAGQGNYAAANVFLDAFAQHRQALGLPAVSLAWGLWAERSAAVRELSDSRLAALSRGSAEITTEHGMALLDAARTLDIAALVPLPLNPAALRASARTGELPALLRDLVTSPVRRPAARVPDAHLPNQRWAGMPTTERDRALLALVRSSAATTLGHNENPDTVRADRAFRDLGFDSLTAVELRNRLATATGLRLPAGLVFDHPTPEALAAYLGTRLSGTATRPAYRTGSAGPAAPEDPVAIVSMGCRWPGGVSTPEELWRLLRDGVDALTGFPTDRGWDADGVYASAAADTGTPRLGGFLDDAAGFDAHFFGIGPHEATAMDPQQRVLLEATWETLERAGIDPSALRGSPTGVFVGLSPHGYGVATEEVPHDVAVHLLTGTTASVASGRVSYVLGLEGPAVTVDTACSSALVAVHLAAQSLRQGECHLALAAGVAVMATPAAFSSFSGQHGLSSDGRVKAFAASADGTGWGEGVGVFLLERLSDARRNGHPVLALVRGSAMNQDGASNGLTAPNGPAQERVIHRALATTGLTPGDVDAVEAHGTGTRLGDPIEAHALISAYGREHTPDRPLWLGSVKSNIGHTQAAAGAAGLMKMVLALRHSWLPATLHVDQPTPEVDWADGAVRLLTEGRPWPDSGSPRRAGVSSFGVSGTNAHLILEQAPPVTADTPATPRRGAVALPLSGRTDAAVREQARLLVDHLASAGHRWTSSDLAGVGHTLATARTTWEHRAVVVGANQDDLRGALAAVADGAPGTVRRAARSPGRTAFLFSGQGSQRVGMGQELAESHAVFADALDEVYAGFDRLLPRRLRDVVAGEPELLASPEFAQPALFAVQVALYRLLVSWGLRPDLLLGHSLGEFAAGHVAGVLPLSAACELVAVRGRLIRRLPPGGAMVACRASAAEVMELLARCAPDVEVAAVNSPLSTVISGAEDQVLDVAAVLAARGYRTKRVAVTFAAHSAMVDPILDEFREVAAGMSYHPPAIPLVSTYSGRLATAEDLSSPDYWVDQARGTVRFHDGVRRLVDEGVTTFVEIGPGGALTTMAQECVPDGSPFLFVPTLPNDRPEARSVVATVAEAHAHGATVDWPAVLGDHRPVTDLPTYPFQRRRFWLSPKRPDATSALYGIDWSTVDVPPNRPVATVAVLGQRYADVPRLREAIVAGTPAPDAVLVRLSGDTLQYQALTLLREWLAADLPPACRLVVATTSAVACRPGERVPDPHATSVWGLVRSAQWEHPGRFVLLDDTGTDDPDLVADALATGEPQLAARDGALFVPRLGRVGDPVGAPRWDPTGTVLVTGGSGRLAPLVARHLVTAHGVRRLLVVSRRGTAEGLDDVAGDGVTVDVVACDVTDRDALAAVLAAIPAEHPLTGIVHLARVADHGLLDTLTGERLAAVLRPATVGATNLHELTETLPLSAFVLFSSVAGVTGAIGHAAEGAAAAYLDGLAQDRRARGLAGTALAWGPWAAADTGNSRGRTELRALPTAEALALFDAGTAASRASLLPLGLDLAALERMAGLEPVRHLMRALARPPHGPGNPPTVEGTTEESRAALLAGTPPVERRAALLDLVRAQAASVLGYGDAEPIADDRGFLEQGFDSLTGVELRNRLAAATELTLPATIVFDQPSPTALADHLAEELGRRSDDTGQEDGHRTDSLLSLFRDGAAAGQDSLCNDLLVAASRLRPSFGLEEAAKHTPPAVRLASGPARYRLICLPAAAATAGPQQYARFAAEFRGRRDVLVFPNPGFVDGEFLPDSVETLVELHADQVRAEMAENGPAVLVGHSGGGLIAHVVATRLEQTGHAPPAVVLVDTSWPGEMQAEAGAALVTEMLKREGTLHHVLTPTRLSAMGGYGRILSSFEPAATEVPTLLVRATRTMPVVPGAASAVMPRVVWKLDHSTAEVDGDHFTVMEDAADQTARAVDNWLDALGRATRIGPAARQTPQSTTERSS